MRQQAATWLRPERLAPILAGLAGIGWFLAELSPQGYGFNDTDDPSVGLRFVAAHPTVWALDGVLLLVAAMAMVVAAIVVGDRLARHDRWGGGVRADVSSRAVTAIGLLAAAFLFGNGVLRLGGGPLLYVQGLDQGWGETAYLVTQFVGVHMLAQGGITLLSIWVVAVAWLGNRRGVIPRPLALLALLPGVRLLAVLGPWSLLPEGLWIFSMAAIPAGFLWLVLLGVSSADTRVGQGARLLGTSESGEATA